MNEFSVRKTCLVLFDDQFGFLEASSRLRYAWAAGVPCSGSFFDRAHVKKHVDDYGMCSTRNFKLQPL